MSELKTKVCDIINRDCLVYSILGDFGDENKRKIREIQEEINKKFEGLIWKTPPEALHITLLVWINSWIDNLTNGDEIFEKLFPDYNEALDNILKKYTPVKIEFNKIEATKDAIILIGKDNGEFQKIRSEFIKKTSIGEKIKQPKIIHSTIARFQKEYDLEEVNEFLKTFSIAFNETIERFKLPRETKKPMLEYEIKKHYNLAR